jgi:hypothetical protein
MKRIAPLLAVVLLAGCGGGGNGPSEAEKAMNDKFQQLDFKIATMESNNTAFGSEMEDATREYIALVRQYKEELGAGEAARRLVEKGDEIGPYCFICKSNLYEEAKKYAG